MLFKEPPKPTRPQNPLLVEPRPLFLDKGRIAVVWSMKSACSHIVLWAFACQRLLPASRYYHPWPHEFRQNVYYGSVGYQRDRRSFAEKQFGDRVVIRFTRDPVKRMISVFRHVCRYNFAWDAIRREIGLDVAEHGLSLAEFDRFLGTQDLVLPCRTNPHICAQWHPINRLPQGRSIIVNIDTHSLNDALLSLSEEFGLRWNAKALDQAVHRVAGSHYAAVSENRAALQDLETRRFKRDDVQSFPSKELAATSLAQSMARTRHGIDMDTVATQDSAGRLFQ